MSKSSELEALLKPKIEQSGYECVEVEFKKQGPDWVLTCYIDHSNGIGIEDCQKVSEILSPYLDEVDPIEPAYLLEVSSPGIDRPLKNDRDFEKNLNKEIEIHLFESINGEKDFSGILKDYNEDEITLEINKEPFRFNRKKISKAQPVIVI